jgi:RNA polymerase sigma-70 factor (ECF subfamily)
MKELQPDEVALLRGFQSRDQRIINKLHGHIYQKLFWFAFKILKDRDQAHDAVTEAFIALLNAHNGFVSIDNIQAWLYTRVRWNCSTALRPKAGHDKPWNIDDHIEMPDEDATVEERKIQAEVYHAILQEIERLSDRNKKIMKLSFFEGMSSQEIADELEMNVKTVRNTRTLLLKTIKNELIRKSLTILILSILLPVK